MRKNWKPLLLIYGAAVALRFILALLCTQAPVVNIDEYLYMSIAKSLASSGEVLYSGQPADFSSLLYSVCLTPVYLLFRDGADYYRLLQLWSILLINLSVFPAFSLARELTGDRKTALLLSALTALTADFAFGAILMAECVIYPLTLTALWLGYRWLKEHRFSYALLIGVCLELLYEAKPGAVAVPAVLLVTMAAVLLRGKETKRLLQPLCGLAVAGAIFLVFRLLFGSASVYTQQLALPVGERLEAFGIALARMPAMFLLAGGFGAVLLPVMRIGKYTRADRCFLIAVLAALTVTVIGTAWIINRYESATRAVHIRYIAVYLPVFLFFTAIPVEGSAAGKKTRSVSKNGFILPLCALGYTALILILWGPGSIEQSPVAAQSLSLTKLLEGTPAMILLLLLAGGMTFFLLREKSGERLKKLCLYVAAGWILVNGACRYTLLNASQTGCMQVDELLELIDGRNYLYLNTFPDNWTVAGKLNAATEKDPGHVDINFFMNHMWSPPGVYTPYIPEPARGTIPDRETPDTGVLVLDFTAYRMITFAENVKTVYSPDLMLCAAEYTPGERLADSMLANIWNLVLSAGKPGILALFSPELSSSPVKVSFCIETDTETEMSIRNGTESYIVPLHPGQEWYEIDFGSAASAMNFSVSDTDIRVLEYRVEPIGQ